MFLVAPDFESATDIGGDKVYDVIVQVSDGTIVDTQAIAITVSNMADSFVGTADNDVIVGSSEEDSIDGLAGNDIIDGVAGNDTITGGTGADVLTGDLGADVFVIGAGAQLAAGETIPLIPRLI